MGRVHARRALIALVVALTAVAWAADYVVDDWRSYALGARGIPENWQEQTWGRAVYDFQIIEDNGRRALHMRSKGDSSTISRDLRDRVSFAETPVLEWSWKVVLLPRGGYACHKSTDDETAQIYVSARSRIIGYIWDSTAPIGTICQSQKAPTVTYIVVRSGAEDLGRWITERRNIVEDFRNVYGEAPAGPTALSISIDSDDGGSSAESFMGAIGFTRR
jgi:hypothetical protein